ncbi:hypothetical protein [Streptomyces sp. NPDC056987]|uniref:hypothetical protein n=1 Tax=Streptomyces sp. NPDC056987 TaxID=3345988 RepID=UPI0036348A0B
MLVTLVTAALAIVGTLLGSIVSGRFQERAAERSVRVSHGEAIRRDRLEAGSERIEALRGESHMTRSAVTRPLVALRVLIEDQAVRAAADEMVTLTYALRDAYATTEALTAAREAAKGAHDRFVDVAAGYLSRTA